MAKTEAIPVLYMKGHARFHAQLGCMPRMTRDGMVGDMNMLRAEFMKPCRRCWSESGYVVSRLPEAWEGAAWERGAGA